MHRTSDPSLLSVLGGGHVTHVGALPAATEKKKLPVPKILGQSACRPRLLVASVVPHGGRLPE